MGSASKLFDYDVRDPAGIRIGTVEAVWEDERTGGVEFLGVRTTWLADRIHLVPTAGARIDDVHQAIWIRWTERKVRDAPSFAPEDEIRPDEEARIYAYFGMAATERPPASGALPTGEPSAEGARALRARRHDEHLAPRSRGSPRH